MTRIKPFCGILYNPENNSDLSRVMCPPYDVISKEDQEKFYKSDPYNFIRIDFGKDNPIDNKKENKYTRSARYLEEWLNKNILLRDSLPCFYFYLHEYTYKRKKMRRLGFIGLMKLEYENAKVFPHENTHSQPKEDRLELMRTVRGNLSPIFAFFYDKEGHITNIFENHILNRNPNIAVVDNDNVIHKLWRLSDKALINKIREYMQDEHIFIADGHHRYEVALNFAKELKVQGADQGVKDYNYIMTYFTNLDSDDLLILPIHRLVKRMPKDINTITQNFDIQKVGSLDELSDLMAKHKNTEGVFGFYQNKEFFILILKDTDKVKYFIPNGSDQYRRLDVSILQYLIFAKLGINDEDLIYTKDDEEAIQIVDKRNALAAFILNPVNIQQLRDIAFRGEKMPPKSTYFYPKLLSGLVISKFNV